MAKAIRVISIERGYDPRDYTLVAFGGAGPLHAARLARELDIPRVLIPTIPGILCAYGLLVADLRTDFSRTVGLPATEEALPTVNAAFADLSASATDWFAREQVVTAQQRLQRVADLRYVGQNYELPVDLPDRPLVDEDLPQLRSLFHEVHEQAYGYAAEHEPVQIVTLRLVATGIVTKPEPGRIAAGGTAESAVVGQRQVYLPELGGWDAVSLYDRGRLNAGMTIPGPGIVEQMDATTLVLPGQWAEVDTFGNLLLVDEHGGVLR